MMEEAEDRLKEYQHKKDDTNYWVVSGELQNQSVDNIINIVPWVDTYDALSISNRDTQPEGNEEDQVRECLERSMEPQQPGEI